MQNSINQLKEKISKATLVQSEMEELLHYKESLLEALKSNRTENITETNPFETENPKEDILLELQSCLSILDKRKAELQRDL